MKIRIILISFSFFLVTGIGFAQKKSQDQNFITGKVVISKYHDRDELEGLPKGQLLDLYVERVEIIVKILPIIAFATKPGVTMTSLGIPNTKDHRKALKENIEASEEFFEGTIEFQKKILPYSDSSNLISAILFYEETLKSLHTYNEYVKF